MTKNKDITKRKLKTIISEANNEADRELNKMEKKNMIKINNLKKKKAKQKS